MIFVLIGDNEFGKQARVEELISEFKKQDPNGSVERLDGSEIDGPKLLDLSAQSLFSKARFVIVNNLSLNTNGTQLFTEVDSRIPDETVIVLREKKLKKNTTFYKHLKKTATIEEFSEMNSSQLAGWVVTFAQKNDAEISRSDAQLLVNRVGENQMMLASEIKKLTMHDAAITKQSIELLTDQTPQDNVFDLLDQIGKGKGERARAKYRELRRAQVEPHYVMSMIGWQLGNMAMVVAHKGKTAQQIAAEAGMSPYVVQKAMSATRDYSIKDMSKMLDYAAQADRKLKKSAAPSDQLIEQLIDRLSLIS